MSDKSSLLNKKNMTFLAWLVVLPFLASWPFISAFPAFSLMSSSAFDVSTSINLVFLLTGFWSIAILLAIAAWLTRGNVRAMIGSGKVVLVGGYAVVWTGLYALAAIVNR
jgi:hypothetical protein